ncbi:MAG: hypothetical protein MK135_02650 [Polyangiaceae bacterium]|nr:hypothetical protein [Polyangiaceae bacterium]
MPPTQPIATPAQASRLVVGLVAGSFAFCLIGSSIVDTIRPGSATLGYLVITLVLFALVLRFRIKLDSRLVNELLLLGVGAIIGLLAFWEYFEHYVIYGAALLATLFLAMETRLGPQVINQTVKYCVFLATTLAVYETLTQEYLFVLSTELMELDEKLFSGRNEIFRAKGPFYGPLTLGKFYLLAAILLRQSPRWVLICGAGALLTQSRTAGLLITCLYLLDNGPAQRLSLLIRALLGAGVVSVLVYFFGVSGERMVAGTDLEETGNAARIFFWQISWDYFSDYNLGEMIFGNSGAWTLASGGLPTESAVIYTLLDGGLLLLSLIFLPLLGAMRRRDFLLSGVLIIAASNVNLFYFGRMSSLFFFFLVWRTLLHTDKAPSFS